MAGQIKDSVQREDTLRVIALLAEATRVLTKSLNVQPNIEQADEVAPKTDGVKDVVIGGRHTNGPY